MRSCHAKPLEVLVEPKLGYSAIAWVARSSVRVLVDRWRDCVCEVAWEHVFWRPHGGFRRLVVGRISLSEGCHPLGARQSGRCSAEWA